ncbi:MAG: hypothetical protein MI919_15720 [Holophagales bacterium]|nr:hypothetical protein [Holophagales bacterium]
MLRAGLWALPLLLVGLALLGMQRSDHSARLHEARLHLIGGDLHSTEGVLLQLAESPWVGEEARAGLRIVGVFESEQSPRLSPEEAAQLASGAFPLPLLIRTAFERGQFASALRLQDLAESLQIETVPWLKTAARIEEGLPVSQDAVPEAPPVPSRLAARVASHLESSPAPGALLRDRREIPLGHLVEGRLEPASGVRPELLPRAVEELHLSHPEARTLRLALDLELSRAAYQSFGRYRGSIVLVDPRTGEILAAVSDRRTFARTGGTPAFEQAREPASISKLITTAAYLRSGRDPDARLRNMRCRGHERYDGVRLYCPVIAGPLRGLDRAMAVSCNVAFANLAVEVGRRGLVNELRRFGFDSELGSYAGGRILQAWGDDRQLADMAIGLEVTEITPLHAALVAAVVANDGVLPEPTLLGSTDGRLGLHPRPVEPGPGRRVLERRWLPTLLGSMTAVMRRGTGMRMATRGFPVAMKTGTASDPRHGFHVNYIGIGPMPHARVAFCVRITHQGTSKRVRRAATEVTARLLRKLRRISAERGWQSSPPPAPVERLARLGIAHPAADPRPTDPPARTAR